MQFDAYSIRAASTKVASGASSATVAMPTTLDGKNPKYVRVSTDGNVYVQPVEVNPTAITSSNGILVTPNEALFLSVRGMPFLSYIQSTAAANVTISPIEA